jgi:hypothetical protein
MKIKPRNLATALAAIVVVSVAYSMARFPSLSPGDRMKLAVNFKFDKLALAEVNIRH